MIAEDLAFAQREADVLEDSIAPEVLYREDCGTEAYAKLGIAPGAGASGHHSNELVAAHGAVGKPRGNPAAVKHRDAIADLAELVELVRDIEDADSPVPDLPHYLEEYFALGVGHAGGRFVEYDDLGIGNARLRRRDDEPLRVPELGHQGFGRYRYPEAREEGFAVFVELVAVERASDGSSAARYATEEDVFRDAQVVEKLGVLVLHHYPRAPRFIYGPEIDHAAVEEYLSLRRGGRCRRSGS